jgi:hypothetical protein
LDLKGLEQVVDEVLIHHGIHAPLHELVGDHLVLADGGDQRHGELLFRGGTARGLLLKAPGFHTFNPELFLINRSQLVDPAQWPWNLQSLTPWERVIHRGLIAFIRVQSEFRNLELEPLNL